MTRRARKAEPKDQPTLSLFKWFAAMHRELPGYMRPILGFSLVSNLLLLVSPLYMLQVYDRILTSGSKDTLVWITLIAVFLLGIYGVAELGRRRACNLAAEHLDEIISERVFARFDREPRAGETLPNDLRVLSRIRGFFQNQTVLPFFDFPFAPLFLAAMFVIHPLIGLLGLAGGAALLTLAITAEATNRRVVEEAGSHSSRAFTLASGLSRQRSAIVSMGLTRGALSKWRGAKAQARELNMTATAREGAFTSATRAGRQTLQILILGAGGALAITQQVSPGAIVAGSIILSRAIGPIDQIVGSWRGIAGARSAWVQLSNAIAEDDAPTAYTPLPKPDARLSLDRLSITVPGRSQPLIRPFGATLEAGAMIALIGGNGCGKTSLLQALAGAHVPNSGKVSLGGRDLHDWPAEDRGGHVGYVPQTVELLPGTVSENIARMSDAEPARIIEAARSVGAHDMILGLPLGYDTPVGTPGVGGLSAGQRQLIGLARAVFGDPVLILLDEPTANLDPMTAHKTVACLRALAQRGLIVVTATHDIKLIQATSSVFVIQDGGVMMADTARYLDASRPKSAQRPATSQITSIGAVA